MSAKTSSDQGIVTTQPFGFWGRGLVLAMFVAEYGIPIFEVATVLGEDGVDVLTAFLGAGGLKCGRAL